jgi:Flp pilus assembly protein TadG
LALLAILLPLIFGFLALTIDASLLMARSRDAQHATDAAATAAARDLSRGWSSSVALTTATDVVTNRNGLTTSQVTVNIPPTSGPHTGVAGYVEVITLTPSENLFERVFGSQEKPKVRSRSVAGAENATTGAALVVLDPTPSPITVAATSLISITIPPVDLAGLEILGLGSVKVDGAVHVNTEWGGRDENWDQVGANFGLPYAVTCTPLLPLSKLQARDVRVVGGVDTPNNYISFSSGGDAPLQANRQPVPDPYRTLPAPSTASDPTNVSTTNYGGVSVTGLPLIGPTKHLYPGVYDWIQVVSGKAMFHPGVYIIRGKNPVTQISLALAAAQITANGCMFYVTNSASYSASTGSPDSGDGEIEPAAPGVTALLPSIVINTALLGSEITGLNSPGSPFHGMVLYQRRQDRRPIAIVGLQILGTQSFSGNVYAKWGQIVFAGEGTYDANFVAGTMRFVNVLGVTFKPTTLLPAAKDVYLVE